MAKESRNSIKRLAIINTIYFVLALIVLPLADVAEAGGFDPGFNTNSSGIYLVNLKTNSVMYEKDADKILEPASITKIMTYIVVLENCEDIENTVVTVSEDVLKSLADTGSALSGLKAGEELKILDLLHCLLIASGNDAALTLAEHISGNVEDFVELMNSKAQMLGCNNTHFANPHGLHDEDHYTTARDVYKIAEYAMNLPHFMDICSQVSYLLPDTNKQESRRIYTTNKMMLQLEPQYYYPYAKGIKTGWHDMAGYCVVSTATYGSDTYLCVALGAPNEDKNGKALPNGAFIDSKSLYKWVFTNFSRVTIAKESDPVAEVAVDLCWNSDTVLLTPETNVDVPLPNGKESKDVKFVNITVPKDLKAPIKKGELVGFASLECEGNIIQTDVKLVAASDIKRSNFLLFISILKSFFESWVFILIIMVLLILATLYGAKLRSINKKSRHMKVKIVKNNNDAKYDRF